MSIDVDADLLGSALSQVVRAASTDESRQVLTGVLWEIEAGSVTLAATDSYRLAVRTLDVAGGPAELSAWCFRRARWPSSRVRCRVRPARSPQR